MFCIFLVVFLLFFLEIQYMLAVFVWQEIVEGNEVLLQNCCLHFIFCCSHLAYKDCNGKASITVLGDNEPPF